MTISTLDGLVAASWQKKIISKASITAKAAGTIQSLWKSDGFPLAGSTPPTGVGDVPTKATTGAFNFAEPSGLSSYLGRFFAQNTVLNTLIIYDRLVHTSGLVGNVNTLQSVDTTALTRSTDGVGVDAYVEWYTATGSSAATLTVNFTNSDGDSDTTSVAFVQTPAAGQMIPIASGVRSVQSVQLSTSTGTAGDFGITLAKTLAEMPIETASVGKVMSPFDLGLPSISAAACLALMAICSGSTTGTLRGSIDIVQG